MAEPASTCSDGECCWPVDGPPLQFRAAFDPVPPVFYSLSGRLLTVDDLQLHQRRGQRSTLLESENEHFTCTFVRWTHADHLDLITDAEW